MKLYKHKRGLVPVAAAAAGGGFPIMIGLFIVVIALLFVSGFLTGSKVTSIIATIPVWGWAIFGVFIVWQVSGRGR